MPLGRSLDAALSRGSRSSLPRHSGRVASPILYLNLYAPDCLRGPLEFLQASYTRAVRIAYRTQLRTRCEPLGARALNPSCGLGSLAPFFAVAPKASSTKPEYRQ